MVLKNNFYNEVKNNIIPPLELLKYKETDELNTETAKKIFKLECEFRKCEIEHNIRNITIIGAGRWGSSIAIHLLRKNFSVTIQTRSTKTYRFLVENSESPYLPGMTFKGDVKYELDINKALNNCEMAILSVRVPYIKDIMSKMDNISDNIIFVCVSKGLGKNFRTVPAMVSEKIPNNKIALLSGPCFPNAMISGTTPISEVLACKDLPLSTALQSLFSTSMFRVYKSQDVEGVAVLGSLKNIFALSAGIVRGLQYEEETLAVLVTKGFAEIHRICQRLDIPSSTLYGVSGLGDMLLTCYSLNSHNGNFGYRLGMGQPMKELLSAWEGPLPEGYFTTSAVYEFGKINNLKLPLINTIYEILYKSLPVKTAVNDLMTRPLGVEAW